MPSLGVEGSGSAGSAVGGTPRAEPQSVVFLKQRDDIFTKMQSIHDEMEVGNTGTIKLLGEANNTFEEKGADKSGLPFEYQKLIESARSLRDDAMKAKVAAGSMTRNTIETHRSQLLGLEKRAQQLNEEYNEQDLCAQILLTRAIEDSRRSYQRDYQKERRFATALRKGKFSEKHANFMAGGILEMEEVAEECGDGSHAWQVLAFLGLERSLEQILSVGPLRVGSADPSEIGATTHPAQAARARLLSDFSASASFGLS